MSKSVIVLRNSVSTSLYSSDESCSRTFYQRRRRELLIKDKSSINPNVYIRRLVFWATFQIHPNFVYHQDVITINTRGGNLLAPHNSIRFRLWGQRFDSEAIIDASRCNTFFDVNFHVWISKIYIFIWVCYWEFANHFLLLWWSLKTSTDELTYLIFHKRESFCHKYDFLWTMQ